MSKSKLTGRKLSGSQSDHNPLKSDPNKYDGFPSLSTPTFVDDFFSVEKASKTSQKLRHWLNGDSSSETRFD
jgi:hypothetical protein